jgi:hypothetical protein
MTGFWSCLAQGVFEHGPVRKVQSTTCSVQGRILCKPVWRWFFLSVEGTTGPRVAWLMHRVGQNHLYIQCIYGNLGRKITKYTVVYGVFIRFWPTLLMQHSSITHLRTRPFSLQACLADSQHTTNHSKLWRGRALFTPFCHTAQFVLCYSLCIFNL